MLYTWCLQLVDVDRQVRRESGDNLEVCVCHRWLVLTWLWCSNCGPRTAARQRQPRPSSWCATTTQEETRCRAACNRPLGVARRSVVAEADPHCSKQPQPRHFYSVDDTMIPVLVTRCYTPPDTHITTRRWWAKQGGQTGGRQGGQTGGSDKGVRQVARQVATQVWACCPCQYCIYWNFLECVFFSSRTGKDYSCHIGFVSSLGGSRKIFWENCQKSIRLQKQTSKQV